MFNQAVELAGLTSIDTAVPAAGPYVISGKLTVPCLVGGASSPSGVVVTITNRTGPVTLYTSHAGDTGFEVATNCAAGDVIRIAVTSSSGVDQGLNVVRTIAGISSGVS